MTNFVPIFPMEIVIYPEEVVTVPVSGSLYKQLIYDCRTEDKPMGVPVLREGKALEYGTSVEISEVEEGAGNDMQVKLKGLGVFRILEFVKDIPGKPYAGAIVSYPENDTMKVHPGLSGLITSEVKRLYTLLNIENMPPDESYAYNSYELAHKLGLTREQEYELLCIFNEVQRMEYLRRYFNSIMPEIDNIERIKSRINPN